jgi:hypothetical protein
VRSKLRHPIRAIREPFGTAGLIVACVALIAALGGSAIAANNALTGKQKKQVKKIAKKFAGQNGAQGPAGQAGSQGPKGDTGAAGANGANGKDGTNGTNGTNGKDGAPGATGKAGESVNVIDLNPGDNPNCEQGGAKIVNDSGTEEAYACNGEDGEGGGGGGWPETLPSGSTMTGPWEVLGEAGIVLGTEEFAYAAANLAFPVPLETAPTEVVVIWAGAEPEDSEEEKEKCPGTSLEPKAIPGVLCMYTAQSKTPVIEPKFEQGVERYGSPVYFEKDVQALGIWAVTAE